MSYIHVWITYLCTGTLQHNKLVFLKVLNVLYSWIFINTLQHQINCTIVILICLNFSHFFRASKAMHILNYMILYVDNSANKMELIYLDLFVKLNVMKPLLYLLCNILISLVLCILEFPFSQLHTDIRVDCTLPRIFKYEKKTRFVSKWEDN